MTANLNHYASKVPEVTLGFWIIKILAATLGETSGDSVTMTWLCILSERKTEMGEPRWNRLGQNGRDMLQMCSALFLLRSRAPAWSTRNP